MTKCNCVYEPFCSMLNGSDVILPTPCEYRKDSTNFVEVKHGRWVVENEESIRCSECCFNRASIKIPLDYCPNCGAHMKDGE